MLNIRKGVLAKILGLAILALTSLALLEHLIGQVHLSAKHQIPSIDDEYERQVLEDEARIVPWLGQGGVPVHSTGKDAELGVLSLKKNAINVFLSDQIPYNRTLNDLRNAACHEVLYDAELPSVSVILIFHDEPYSVILRTVWSVLNSCRRTNQYFKFAGNVDRYENILSLGYPGQDPESEYVYLKEIILVDDNSTMPELKGKLSHYIRTRLPPDLIRILRLPDRKGLTQARMAGAKMSRGRVLLFLDAHCEVGSDWLRPMLQRIVDKRDTVVTPVIEIIDEKSFELQPVNEDQVAGFNFNGIFSWITVSSHERNRRGYRIAPTRSPTMAGGLFAIDRSYFWELGGYDEQMTGWGGENLEMSFRVWMCGGTLEVLPCSRVGHIFRSFPPRRLATSDTFGVNMARAAEVWMDDYKEIYYLYRMDLRNNPIIGDVTHRKILREKLKCKTFQWYLDNVYRDKFVPIRDVYAWGRIMNANNMSCLDRFSREPSSSAAASVYPCHADLKPSQFWSLTKDNRIRSESACLDVHRPVRNYDEPILIMVYCDPAALRRQKFRTIIDNRIQHIESGLCIEAKHPGDNIRLVACDAAAATQKWKFDFNEDTPLQGPLFQSQSQIQILEKLRRKRQ